MQGLAIFGLLIISAIIYCSITLIVSIFASMEDEDSYFGIAWVTGCVLFVIVVMFWATRPFPVSIG